MEGKKMVKVSLKQRLVLVTVIAVVLIAAVLLFVLNYSNVGKPNAGQNSLDQQENLAEIEQKLASDYRNQATAILGAYLTQDASSTDFAQATSQTQGRLLELKVPASYKDKHLSAVLSFNKIQVAITKKDSAKIKAELAKLQTLVGGLK